VYRTEVTIPDLRFTDVQDPTLDDFDSHPPAWGYGRGSPQMSGYRTFGKWASFGEREIKVVRWLSELRISAVFSYDDMFPC
jgi:hypothetical protein